MRFLFAVVLIALAMPSRAAAQQSMCWLNTPSSYQTRLGGAARLGPLPCTDCETSRARNFGVNGSCTAIAGGASGGNLAAYAASTAIESLVRGFLQGLSQRRSEQTTASAGAPSAPTIDSAALERQRLDRFNADKKEIAGQMKSTAAASSEGLKRTDDGARDVPKAWKDLSCSVSLSLLAIRAATRNDFEEASLLSRDGATVLSGGQPSVACPNSIAANTVPPVGKVSCFVNRAAVPCDEPPLTSLMRDVELSARREIERLSDIHKKYPDLQGAQDDAAAELQASKEKATNCTTALCREAQRELEAAKKADREITAVAKQEAASRSALDRDGQILGKFSNDPAGLQRILEEQSKPARRP